MPKPLLSVIVPVYRVEPYLNTCVRSILAQTYENLEVILVDDGSPDGCGALCDAWADKDPRVRVIHQKNAGGGPARNAGLDAATGELVAFVDSDDYIAPQMYDTLYSLLEQGADIAECAWRETEGEDALLGGGDAVVWYPPEEAMEAHIRDTFFTQRIWNKLCRRSVAEAVRFPAGTKIDDEFFTYRLLGNAKKLVRCEKQLYAYRQQPGSIMHTADPVKKQEGLRAKQQRLAFLQEAMPALVPLAKGELVLACLYAIQEALRLPKGPQRQEICRETTGILRSLEPIPPDCGEGTKQRLLIRAARKWPLGVSRGLNLLLDLHILT